MINSLFKFWKYVHKMIKNAKSPVNFKQPLSDFAGG